MKSLFDRLDHRNIAALRAAKAVNFGGGSK